MKQYKVIALSCHSDLTQRVFTAGEIVGEDAFHAGHAQQMAADGFLEEIIEAPAEETPPPPPPAEESAATKAGKSKKA